MAKRGDLGARLRYEFDKSMSAGPIPLVGWLALAALVLVLVAAILIALTGIAPEGAARLGMVDAVWAALTRTLDPAPLAGDLGWPFRVVMLLVTIGGLLLVAALIGVIAAAIAARQAELRRGRSPVVETDHTIILNWSPMLFEVISELAGADAGKARRSIVVMAPGDSTGMADGIAARIGTLSGRARVICRSGDPADPHDLAVVSPETARSIIVLSPDAADPDGAVLKTVLALVNAPDRRPSSYRIAAVFRSAESAELARTIAGREIQAVMPDDLAARIIAHSSRQPGLGVAYAELLDSTGSRLHVLEQPTLTGNTFGDSLMAYNTATLIGVSDAGGRVYLNPPMETQMQPGLKAVILAEDEPAIRIAVENIEVDISAIALPRIAQRLPERILMLGWNRRASVVARELSRFVIPGSVLTVAADIADLDAAITGLSYDAERLTVEYGRIDTASRAALESLDIPSYDQVLVLGHADDPEADIRTLKTLLHLRTLVEGARNKVTVVAEMSDGRSRDLAEVTRADDFVVLDRLGGLMAARASANDHLAAVLADLFDERSSEVHMRPAGDYIELGRPVSFYTIVEAARRRGEVALGYARKRSGADDPRRLGGVVVNPRKSEAVMYQTGDRIVVLARD